MFKGNLNHNLSISLGYVTVTGNEIVATVTTTTGHNTL